MKPNILLRATLRQPVRAALMWLLVALVSFAFVANMAEYLVVMREIERLGARYPVIGRFHGRQSSLPAVHGLLTESRHVEVADHRRVVSGVMRDFHNADATGMNFFMFRNYRMFGAIVYGTVLYIGEPYDPILEQNMMRGGPVLTYHRIRIHIDTLVSGYTDYVGPHGYTEIRIPVQVQEQQPLQVGQRYLLRIQFAQSNIAAFPDNPTGRLSVARLHNLPPHSNPLLILPLNMTGGSSESGAWLRDIRGGLPVLSQYNGGPLFVHVGPDEFVDLDAPEWGVLRDDMAVLNVNQRTMAVMGTRDMATLPNVWEGARRIELADGRWLNAEDYAEARRVIVIPQYFAQLRGIQVGDTLTMALRDNQHVAATGPSSHIPGIAHIPYSDYHGYIIADQHGTWQALPVAAEEAFTVVGIYRDAHQWGDVTRGLMYVPDSVIPAWFGGFTLENPRLDLVSFALRSHRDIDAFFAEHQAALDRLDLSIVYADNNAVAFWSIIAPLRQSKRMSMLIYSMLLVCALALTAFLYTRQRQKEFAVMRALGVPKRSAVSQMLTPIGWIGLLGIAAGGIPAWRYAIGQSAEAMDSVYWLQPRAVRDVFTAPPLLWLAALCAAVFAALVLMVLFSALRLSQKPVLAMLQGGAAARRNHPPGCAGTPPMEGNEDAQTQFPSSGGVARSAGVVSPVLHYPRSNPAALHVLSFVFRHIRRAPFKTLLTAATAIAFVVALGYLSRLMAQNEASINALYEMTWIRAEVVSETVRLETEIILYKRGVDRILNSGFIQSAAVTTDDTWVVHTENGEMSGIRLRATDQPRESAEPYWQGLQFRYAQGHDAGLFTDPVSAWLHRIPVVLHEGLRAELDVPVGAWITLHNTANGAEVRAVVAGAYRSDTEPDVPLSANRTVMVPLAAIDHQSMGAWFIHPATIEAIINIRHQRAWFVAAEFTIDPAFNRELSATARQLTGIVRMRDSGDTERTQMRMLVHDDALRMNAAPMEGVLSLLTVLYPVLLAVSVLIAAGLALLMAMQSTKNAALLRVLGTTKLRVSAILCVEQVAVCIAGLSVGLAAVFVLFDSDMRQLFVNAGLYLGGALIGSAIAAWRITAKKPLELLQVKD